MKTAFITVGGGLGNQMFQAAFGVALEKRIGVEVHYLADHMADERFGRTFMLDCFPSHRGKTMATTAADGAPAYGEHGVDAASLDELFRQHSKVRFEGYWQSERFFFEEDDAIAASFRLETDAALALRVDELRTSGAIGIHVRRAEFGVHGLAAVDYYRNAIANIRRETGPAPVACFTDEPNFCRGAFRDIPNLVVMPPNNERPQDDLHLLSKCRHFVIANSSFSWWAAWLGATPSSIVYAPLPWCVFDPTMQPVPTRWRAVENAVRAP